MQLLPLKLLRLRRLRRRQTKARRGETVACVYLWLKGYKILARNWYSHYGELDIVTFKNRTLVVVEVKTRRVDSEFPDPLDAKKQDALLRATNEFEHRYRRKLRGLLITHSRIDLVIVRQGVGMLGYKVTEHLENQV